MKRTLLYASIAVLLVLTFVIQETTGGKKNTLTISPLPENLDRIILEQEGQTLELRGDSGAGDDGFGDWKVGPEKFPADADKISELVTAAGEVGRADVISTREAYSKFGLDPDTERVIRLFADGEEVLTLHLGNNASSGASVYGRIDDRREVVLLPLDLADQFTLEISDLREKQIASIPQDEIKRVVITSPGSEELYIIRRNTENTSSASGGTESDDGDDGISAEPGWEARFAGADSTEDIDPGRFRDFFIELADLRASEFLKETPTEDPWADLAIFRQNGDRVTVSFRAPDDSGEFPVTVSTSPYSFTLPKWKARRLFLGIESYFVAFEE